METLLFAYATQDKDGITRDVTLQLDSEEEGRCLLACDLMGRLTAFLKAADLLGPNEYVTNNIE